MDPSWDILSKEVGKQYFRVTNDFYLMELTMMKGGTSHHNTITIYNKRIRSYETGWYGIDYDEGWYITSQYNNSI